MQTFFSKTSCRLARQHIHLCNLQNIMGLKNFPSQHSQPSLIRSPYIYLQSKMLNFLVDDQIVNLSLMYSNRAACQLKTGDLAGAVRDCTRSLQLIPHSVKPLLRRAMAYEHLERYLLLYKFENVIETQAHAKIERLDIYVACHIDVACQLIQKGFHYKECSYYCKHSHNVLDKL